MPDVLKQLSPMSWKGIMVPVEMVEFGFSNETQEQKYVFQSDAILQTLGRKNPTWKVTIPFSQNVVVKDRYKDLYTNTFHQFLDACRDPIPGDLITPDIGTVRAACVSVQYAIDPSKMRDGVRVIAEFVYAPTDAQVFEAQPFTYPTLANVESMAKDLDETVKLVNLPVEDQPKPTVDPFQAIQSVADQITAANDKIKGKLQQVTDKVNRVNKSVAKATDPKNWRVTRQANDLKLALFDTGKQLGSIGRSQSSNKPGTIKSYLVTQNGITVNSLAALLNMDLQAFIKLNSRLAKVVIVPVNTIVYYK